MVGYPEVSSIPRYFRIAGHPGVNVNSSFPVLIGRRYTFDTELQAYDTFVEFLGKGKIVLGIMEIMTITARERRAQAAPIVSE